MKKSKQYDDIGKKIAKAIRCRMAYCEISQKELAEKTGMSTGTVSERLNHPETIRLFEIFWIATVLKIEPEKLMRGEVQ